MSLDEAFHLATSSVPQHLTTRARVTLWALQQQALHGDAQKETAVQGGSWVGRKVLLREWESRRGMGKDEAKEAYINLIITLTKRHSHASDTPLLQTLTRFRDALATRETQEATLPLFGSPQSRTDSTSVPESTTASSRSATDSETGSDSFLSSRESICSEDLARAGGEDGIRVGDDAFTYSRRGSLPSEQVNTTDDLEIRVPARSSTPDAGDGSQPAYTSRETDAPQPAPDLSESIHAIHVSLTALHERLSVLEHLHSQSIRPPSANPWASLLRALGILPSPRVEAPSRGWVLQLLFRLLSTVRRAAVDVSFVLVCFCLFTAGRAALRRRLRFRATSVEQGGRRAMLDFVKGVKEAAERVWR
ncbi:hypothetical protein NCC49_004018 [Naganishia albida]|nr:hypothetical protein NCC49_004018 [Naganishia albida]